MTATSRIVIALAFYLAGMTDSWASPPAHNCHSGGSSCTQGIASWYGHRFQGRRTASGEAFDRAGLTAAHRSLPFQTRLVVTNLANGRSVTVRVNDRGPGGAGRVLDLSEAAARQIGMMGRGFARIEMRIAANEAARG